MIVLKNEEKEITEMFDTVKEFKNFLDSWLKEIEKLMLAAGEELENGYILTIPIDKASFYNKLNLYLEMKCETIETI